MTPAVLVPVGPGAGELERLADTLESVRAFEDTRHLHLVIVDDSPRSRAMPVEPAAWASVDVLRTSLWTRRTPDPYSAMVAGTIEGIHKAASYGPEFLLKLDTDALVIAPFAAKLRPLLADARIGLAGSYTHTCTGARRDWTGWARPLRRASLPVGVVAGRRVRYRSPRHARAVRGWLHRAQWNGYDLGEHCLGGAYAVGPGLLSQAHLLDWQPWTRTGLSEDVVLGLLARALGLRLHGFVGGGEAFGLAWRELPLAPAELLERGYSLVHSVRDQAFGEERELRAYFRARRSTPACRASL